MYDGYDETVAPQSAHTLFAPAGEPRLTPGSARTGTDLVVLACFVNGLLPLPCRPCFRRLNRTRQPRRLAL